MRASTRRVSCQGSSSTQGKELPRSCLVLAGLRGGRRKRAPLKACLRLCPWHCCGPEKGMPGAVLNLSCPRSWQSQGWEVSPSVSYSAKNFVLEMSQSWDLFSKHWWEKPKPLSSYPVKGRAKHAESCSCGKGACLCLCWLASFDALKQTSSLGIGGREMCQEPKG